MQTAGIGDVCTGDDETVKWDYSTVSEQLVLLANSGWKALMIAEREESFIVINVRGDMSDITDVNDERLELMAEAFDFAAIP